MRENKHALMQNNSLRVRVGIAGETIRCHESCVDVVEHVRPDLTDVVHFGERLQARVP